MAASANQYELAYTQTKLAAKLPPVSSHPSEYQVRPSDAAAVAEHRERSLKVFAVDPSRGTSPRNIVALSLPYEPLQAGPIGRLVAVIDEVNTTVADDVGAPRRKPYRIPGLDLNQPEILLAGGLQPSEMDLQSHQQMVYAVAMRTIGVVERALGRQIGWRWAPDGGDREQDKLRIYPHAADMRNSYYHSGEGALYFGYFHPDAGTGNGQSSEIVYTALSYDVVAHEVAFPILDAITGRVIGGEPDEMAFALGFADLLAIFQHFDFPELVVDAVTRTGGRLHDRRLSADMEAEQGEQAVQAEIEETNPLLEIGGQFGKAIGLGGAIRTALRNDPDPKQLATTDEPHERGGILTAAVFDAFITIYSRRTADLRRIGNLTATQRVVSPDLALRLAAEASKTATQFIGIVVRGLDDLPPDHFTLGDYLASLISSDSRAWPADDYHYREALIASFRARGLLPQGATSATEDGLRWLVDSWRQGRRKSTRSRSARLPNVQLKRPAPDRRSLKTFAFDPSAGRSIGNLLAVRIPYEPLKPGPIGKQVAVIDFDASNERYYPSVDLERAEILETGGLDPTDVDPRFHQQMVYAVVVSTLERFQTALGRPIRWPWAGRATTGALGDRLRVYPHAMQEANAYYERNLRGLLFGYFEASRENPGRNLPGQIVYTCLSADIVAHETTHALLDSVQPHFLEKTSVDAPAFHEAIADVVALLGHFSYDNALLDTIQRTGGLIQRDLMNPDAAPTDNLGRVSAERSRGNPLVQLALQFGESLGNRAALRSALGRQPDPRELDRAFEAHDRGAILVAAIFDAFFSVYLRRVADLLRIGRASGAISATGDIHQDLAKRLAKEASDTAVRVSSIAARALDFCPPVDITFGDYLRALVTADYERTHDDPLGFRAAFIDGFLERGIYPARARSMTEEALRWKPWEGVNGGERPRVTGLVDYATDPDAAKTNAMRLREFGLEHRRELGLNPDMPVQISKVQASTSQQFDRSGTPRTEFKFQVLQRQLVPLDPADKESPKFVFRGGSTVVLNTNGELNYVIGKGVDDEDRLNRQREFLRDGLASEAAAGYRAPVLDTRNHLAAQHRGL